MKFEHNILVRALMGGTVGTLIALGLLWTQTSLSRQACWIWTLTILACWLGGAWALRAYIAYPLRTLSNLMEALREGDYSMRLRGADRDDAMGDLIAEVNALTRVLQDRRFSALEATVLLRKTLAQIEVAMFGFDPAGRLCLINDSGRQLLARSEKELMHQTAAHLGLADCLEGDTPRVLELALPGGMRRWEVRRTTYREKGVTHPLIFLSDLTRTLHEEERLAWKRLIQILRHELNNSLTPIQSVAETLKCRMQSNRLGSEQQQDIREGLEIIADRAEELGKFIETYSKLTRLPAPQFAPLKVAAWLGQVTTLETRIPVSLEPGPDVTIQADRGQLDQLMLNILSNAVEAALDIHPPAEARVTLSWQTLPGAVQIRVQDNGPGLDAHRDVFVPFFTTKPKGSGIGLALSRQIAEAHGGYLTLENHPHGPGCQAILWIPTAGR